MGVELKITKELMLQRFIENIFVLHNGCWQWQGAVAKSGYGQISFGSRSTQRFRYQAHRLGWELLKGPIPDNLQIDHRRCRNKKCVNPEHLVLCTLLENVWQPDGRQYLQKNKTHCKQGHPLSGENIYLRPDSKGKHCRICRRAANQRAAKKRRIT